MDPFVEGAILGNLLTGPRGGSADAEPWMQNAADWESTARALDANTQKLVAKLEATRNEVTAESVVVKAMMDEVTRFLSSHPQFADAFRFSSRDNAMVRDVLRSEVTKLTEAATTQGRPIDNRLFETAIENVTRQINQLRGHNVRPAAPRR